MYRIMLVDDEQNILNSLKRILTRKTDWEIETYADVNQALKRATVSNFDLFLSDYRMPAMDGVKFLSQVKQLQPEAMRLILSGYTDLEALLGAINEAEIYRFISKPWEEYDLISAIEKALAYRDVLVENRRLADQTRAQQQELDKRKTVLEDMQQKHPTLFEVNWAADGSIIIEDS